VAGSPNGIAFMAEIDIAIPAKRGVAAPFIAGNADEYPGNLEGVRQAIEFPPKSIGDLEIVRLVPDHIQKGPVSAIFEISLRRIRPEGLAGLTMEIAPKMNLLGFARHA
jgi:hypothetical protein